MSIPIRRASSAAVVALAVALLPACTAPDNKPTPPASSTSTPAASLPTATPESPSPSATPASQEQRAKEQVLALVRKYYAVDEAIATDPKVPLNRYYEVAGGSFVESLLSSAQEQRAKGYRVIGKTKVGTPDIASLVLKKSGKKPPTARVKVCIDVTGVDVVNKRGKSVVDPSRPDAFIERLTVTRGANGWRVTDGEDTGASRCGA